MATITGNYNVSVQSRYYAFLQDDMESAEPHVLIATVEKNRELRKENKTKAKKEKRIKQITEQIKENKKIENAIDDLPKMETEILEQKQETYEKPMETSEPVIVEKYTENKLEKSHRGRGNIRRPSGIVRKGGPPRNEDRIYINDDGNQQKSQDNGYNRFGSNNRGRPYRKDRSEGDNFGKAEDDQPSQSNRGSIPRRRPSGRGGGRFNRGNDRNSSDRNTNDRMGNDRNFNDKTDNDEILRTDIIPENMGTFEEMSVRPVRNNRGRFTRGGNRGGFHRYSGPPQEEENDFDNKIGYFNENVDNREYRGSGRGRSRGGRANRRGRGDFWRPRGGDREENPSDGYSHFKPEYHDVPVLEKWPSVDEEEGSKSNFVEPTINAVDNEFNDVKKSNWGEIEDDPVELKMSNEHMTLEEWKAAYGKDRLLNQEGKENRKANDGQDVFSGMEVYRKGKIIEEQGDEHENHDNQHGRQKQPIPVNIRFSRNTEYGDPMSFDQTNADNRNFSRGVSSGSGYYKNDSKFRGESTSGGRGRSRGGSDFNAYGRGRDFNRGRGRFNRNPYPVVRKDNQVDGVNINLGNEEEFPTLS